MYFLFHVMLQFLVLFQWKKTTQKIGTLPVDFFFLNRISFYHSYFHSFHHSIFFSFLPTYLICLVIIYFLVPVISSLLSYLKKTEITEINCSKGEFCFFFFSEQELLSVTCRRWHLPPPPHPPLSLLPSFRLSVSPLFKHFLTCYPLWFFRSQGRPTRRTRTRKAWRVEPTASAAGGPSPSNR